MTLDKAAQTIFDTMQGLEQEYPLKITPTHFENAFNKFVRDVHKRYDGGMYDDDYLHGQDELSKHYNKLLNRWGEVYFKNSTPVPITSFLMHFYNKAKHNGLESQDELRKVNDFFLNMREDVVKKQYHNNNLEGLGRNAFINKVNSLAYNETVDYVKFLARDK